jgi:trans-2,3-dihydro-3-hydroxyanthranilate isomerase
MRTYPYRLVNVFAESIFGGNPLCVFEHAEGLSDTEMQALALQFNLSETTFLLPSSAATARVRIFAPTFEMAFAGHPTLGSSHVVRALHTTGDALTLEMKAGIIPVSALGDVWTLTAGAAASRAFNQSREQTAAMLGIKAQDVLDGAAWLNTGTEQLIVPLASAEAVARVAPNASLLAAITSDIGRSMAYVFAPDGDTSDSTGTGRLRSRFFFLKHTSVVEDPGTGSATANLGAWMNLNGRTPCRYEIEQGAQVGRPCHLFLDVSAHGEVRVSGRVIEIGRGVVTLP